MRQDVGAWGEKWQVGHHADFLPPLSVRISGLLLERPLFCVERLSEEYCLSGDELFISSRYPYVNAFLKGRSIKNSNTNAGEVRCLNPFPATSPLTLQPPA